MKRFTGVLNSPKGDNLNKMQYVLYNKKYSESFNLTDYLEMRENKECDIIISFEGESIICESGTLIKVNGLWMLNGICIDYKLLDYVGRTLYMEFDDMIDVDCEDVL